MPLKFGFRIDLHGSFKHKTDAQAPCEQLNQNCYFFKAPRVADTGSQVKNQAKHRGPRTSPSAPTAMPPRASHPLTGKGPTPVSEILPPDWISVRETFLQRWSHSSVSVRNPKEKYFIMSADHT